MLRGRVGWQRITKFNERRGVRISSKYRSISKPYSDIPELYAIAGKGKSKYEGMSYIKIDRR
jgi:hypothetical protein